MNSISIFSSPNPGYPFKEVMVTLKGGNLKMHHIGTELTFRYKKISKDLVYTVAILDVLGSRKS